MQIRPNVWLLIFLPKTKRHTIANGINAGGMNQNVRTLIEGNTPSAVEVMKIRLQVQWLRQKGRESESSGSNLQQYCF